MNRSSTETCLEPIDYILRAEGLTRRFNGFLAVDGVDLAVRRGGVHSLIGPNGAGKSTLFNLLTKFVPPSSGHIWFDGQRITQVPPHEVSSLGMVRSFQISAVFAQMSVRENIRVALQRHHGGTFAFWRSAATLRKLDGEIEVLADRVRLLPFLDVQAGVLSYGQKRALEIATTLAMKPRLLLLDEPTAGMGSEDIDRTADLIEDVAASVTILMVEHNLAVVSRLSRWVSVLARGRLLAEGSYSDVSADPQVIEAYLGKTHV
ncbi:MULTISPECIES: ABC transporter ATP-binding protein [unclassified Variovorax]|jgi:branched-chain amino acid transport system ATP-binding protein|uniref:ABC transporter ATP-binding protein n=1 Tax=unclassified Variovorax TaxID=663243 RepID=UPI00178376D6|nr:ABC transporter ATP-binding protein [Variovorax sp. VRV01]MBD9663244.1 ABC transporter ATP-binding protein [Variovorax sp. VRV01]